MNRPKRIVNRALAARSIVRLIEHLQPPPEDAPVNVILKPKEKKKRLPGTALLIKMQKEREKEKAKREAERGTAAHINDSAVDEALAGIFADLEI